VLIKLELNCSKLQKVSVLFGTDFRRMKTYWKKLCVITVLMNFQATA